MRRRRLAAGLGAAVVLVGLVAAVGLVVDPGDPRDPGAGRDGRRAAPSGRDDAGTPAPASSPSPGTTVRACPRPRPPARDPRVTVLTFNVHGGVGRSGYDLAQVAAEIRAWDADVVLLQEVHRYRAASGLADMPADLGRLTGMRPVFGRNFTRDPEADGAPRRRSGTAVLSRLPVRSHRNTRLPNLPGHQPRGLLRVTVDLDGTPVDVYGTHLDPGRGRIRLLQARGIREVVQRRSVAAARPFLLGGDLNTEPGSPAMQVVSRFATDVWPAVGEGGGETVLPRAPRRRIDYVLHGPGWRPLAADTLLSQVADHRAVRATLALEPPTSSC